MKKIVTILFIFALVSMTVVSFTYSSGGPAGNANDPVGSNRQNCTSCHSSYSLQTSGPTWKNMKLTGNWSNGGYKNDSTYTLELEHKISGVSKWGFQITALDTSQDPVGTISVNSSGSGTTRRVSTTKGGNTRYYITHSSSGTSGNGGRDWTFDWKAPSSYQGDVIFYAVVNAANGSGTSGDTIFAREFTIKPDLAGLPKANISVNNSKPCVGDTVSFKGSGSLADSFFWSFTDANISTSTLQNPKVVFKSRGNKSVKLTTKNSKGSSQPATTTIDVQPLPTAFITGGTLFKMCRGDSVKLTAQFAVGNTYLWSNGFTGSNVIWIKNPGKYSVTVSSNGCSRTSPEVSVSEYTPETPTLIKDKAEYCVDDSVQLTIRANAADSFFWSNGTSQLNSGTDSIYTTNVASGFFVGRIKDGNGCFYITDTLSLPLTQPMPSPTVNCDSVTTSTIKVSWSTVNGALGYEVKRNNQAWISVGINTDYEFTGLQPESDQTISVRAIGNAPCTEGEIGSTICKTLPCNSLKVTPISKSTVCEGAEFNIILSGLKGENFSVSENGGNPSQDTLFTYSIDKKDTFFYSIIDSTKLNCPAEDIAIIISVEEKIGMEISLNGGLSEICSNEEADISATSGFNSYKLLVNGVSQGTTANPFFQLGTLMPNTTIEVIGSQQECIESASIVPTIKDAPEAGFSLSHLGSLQFTASVTEPSDTGIYTWYVNGVNTTQGSGVQLDLSAENGDVEVSLEAEFNNGCNDEQADTINTTELASIGEWALDQLSIYPNPGKDVISVDAPFHITSYTIMDLKGAVVAKGKVKLGKIQVDAISNGSYILELDGDFKLSKPVIIRR